MRLSGLYIRRILKLVQNNEKKLIEAVLSYRSSGEDDL